MCPNIRLLIAGDGPEEERLKALAESLGVGDRVHFLGWITDTDSFYHALDINTGGPYPPNSHSGRSGGGRLPAPR